MRAAALAPLAVSAVLAGWLLARGEAAPALPPPGRAAAVSPARLAAVAAGLGHAVYWLGPRRGATVELERTAEGDVYVRYLPRGVPASAPAGLLLTVATYPVHDALAALRGALDAGAATRSPPGGGLAFWSRRQPASVYVARPGSNYQVELYDPDAAQARRLVLARRLRPAGGAELPR